ncbi:MAG: hypothetical protein R2752_15045 [Vicinamibacterales bacterium]
MNIPNLAPLVGFLVRPRSPQPGPLILGADVTRAGSTPWILAGLLLMLPPGLSALR